ncbi:MAG: archease [Candidatus Methylomirabilales bacterium]
MSPYRFLEEVAIADVAFEAEGEDLDTLFEAAALALTETMVDPRDIRPVVERRLTLEADGLEALLFEWLGELIYLKDAEGLLFSRFEVHVSRDPRSRLGARILGEPIDPQRMRLAADVKAATYHLFALEQRRGGWWARVVLDV